MAGRGDIGGRVGGEWQCQNPCSSSSILGGLILMIGGPHWGDRGHAGLSHRELLVPSSLVGIVQSNWAWLAEAAGTR
jgi:hypothetical protein